MSSPDIHLPEERTTPSARAAMRAQKVEVFQKLDLSRGLDSETLKNLAPRFDLQTFAPRATIYKAGDEADVIYGLVEGHVKLLRHHGSRSALLDILPPGTVFGEDALYRAGPRDRTALAYDAVTVITITRDDFRRLLGEQPALYDYVFRVVGERLTRAENKVLDLALDGIARRLAKLLVEMAGRFGDRQADGRVLISLKLPHREIADLIGSTRESVTMHLNDLRRQRLIDFSNRQILITDLASLTAQV